jgi:hypothetical protein
MGHPGRGRKTRPARTWGGRAGAGVALRTVLEWAEGRLATGEWLGSTSWWVSATPPSVARSHATRGGPGPRSAIARTRVSTTAAAASKAERELDRIVRKALAEDGRRGQQLDLFGDLYERAARPARRTVGHAACPTTLRLAGYWPSRS